MALLAKQPDQKEADSEDSNKVRKPYQFLFDYGMVEIEAMTFIRGRSLANTIFIIDEAQNLTPHEAKTVVSRMAEGSRLFCWGIHNRWIVCFWMLVEWSGTHSAALKRTCDYGTSRIKHRRASELS